MCDSLLFIHEGRIIHQGSADSLRRGHVQSGAVRVKITLAGEPLGLLEWLAMHPGWTVVAALPDGARADFAAVDNAALAGELRRMVNDGLAVAGFQVEERLLEDVFIDILKKVTDGGALPPPLPPNLNRN
jgi:ABC-2 type transport system ATP-binding protein